MEEVEKSFERIYEANSKAKVERPVFFCLFVC